MSNITIPGPVTNNLRQGLMLRMGSAIQALDTASLIDRRERSHEPFLDLIAQVCAHRDLFEAVGWEHVNLDPAEIEGVEIDLDDHREALEEGLDQATLMLRRETKEGSREGRAQATIDLAEVERFAASLAALR
jgi:hypothetical protein